MLNTIYPYSNIENDFSCYTIEDITNVINTGAKQDLFKQTYHTPEYIAAVQCFDWACDKIKQSNDNLKQISIEDFFQNYCGDCFEYLKNQGADFNIATSCYIIKASYRYWLSAYLGEYPDYKVDYKSTDKNYHFEHLKTLRTDLDNNRIDFFYYNVQLCELLKQSTSLFWQVDGEYYLESINISRKVFLQEFNNANNQLPELQRKHREANTPYDRAMTGKDLEKAKITSLNASKNLYTLNYWII